MITRYEKGRNAEYYVIQKLRNKGYKWIIRSSASHTPIDILMSNGKEIVAIQCKLKGYLSINEKNALIEWAQCFYAKPYLARKKRGRWILEEVNMRDFK